MRLTGEERALLQTKGVGADEDTEGSKTGDTGEDAHVLVSCSCTDGSKERPGSTTPNLNSGASKNVVTPRPLVMYFLFLLNLFLSLTIIHIYFLSRLIRGA